MPKDNPHLYVPGSPGVFLIRASTTNERSDTNSLTWRLRENCDILFFRNGVRTTIHKSEWLSSFGVHPVMLGNPTATRPTEFTPKALRKCGELYGKATQAMSTQKADEVFAGPVDYREWAANIGDPEKIVPESGLALTQHLERWHLVGGTDAHGDVGAAPEDQGIVTDDFVFFSA